MDNGFTHIPNESQKLKFIHHASIHPVHSGESSLASVVSCEPMHVSPWYAPMAGADGIPCSTLR